MSHGPERRAKRLEITNTCRLMHRHHKAKGLMLDLELIDPYSNEARWVDVTSKHSTCKTRIHREMKGVTERIESARMARAEHTEDLLAGKRGCATEDQAALKFKTYAPSLRWPTSNSKQREERENLFLGPLWSQLTAKLTTRRFVCNTASQSKLRPQHCGINIGSQHRWL